MDPDPGICGFACGGLDRQSLPSRIVDTLSRGGWANPDVFLARGRGGRDVVVKDFAPRGRVVRATLGRYLIDREARVYDVLEGLDAVPRLLGRLDRYALVIEYRPGVLLSRSLAGRLPKEFMAELERAIGAMHARGVVHLDLRHRSNILAGDDGHPVLLDFASALVFEPKGWASRILQPLFAWIDRGAVRKWRARIDRREG